MNISQIPLSIDDYFTSGQKYPERASSLDLNLEKRLAAGKFIEKINKLLFELNVTEIEITSGYRDEISNKRIGGSKNSAHLHCRAIDISDKGHKLYNKCIRNIEILERLGLYLEHSDATPTWIHITDRAPKSGRRIFHP